MEFAPLSCVYGSLIIPQRYVMMVILHLAGMNFFQLRGVLDEVVDELVGPDNETIISDYCPDYTYKRYEKTTNVTWPKWMKSFVGHTFYVGYTVGQIPGGYIADRWGPKHVFGTSMFVCAMATILLPPAVNNNSHSWTLFLRSVLGIFQGPLFPAMMTFIQHWTLWSERPFIGGVSIGGSGLGVFFCSVLTGQLIRKWDSWSSPFYIWGSLTIVWYIIFMCVVFSSPITHPFITEEELEHFEPELDVKRDFSVPWCRIVASRPIWAVFLIKFSESFTTFWMMRVFPKYMLQVLKWDILSDPLLKASPLLAFWTMNIVFSGLVGVMLTHNVFSLLTIRKLYATLGVLIPTVCCLMGVYLECNRVGVYTLLSIAWALKGLMFNSSLLNVNDLTRHYAGTVTGITNGFSSPAAILANMVVTRFMMHGSHLDWEKLHWLLVGVSAISTLAFLAFGEAERQPWDFPPPADTDSL